MCADWSIHDKGHFKSPTKIVPYGQELEDATWAMGKAALMLRNIAGARETCSTR